MKKYISIFVLILVCAMLFVGCGNSKKNNEEDINVEVDYSQYEFTDISWSRNGEHDSETIRFKADGGFSYFCGCGNPVNDSDMCEGYTYDDETKIITLKCFDTSDELITIIKIVKCEDDELHLDFNGDLRIFTRE